MTYPVYYPEAGDTLPIFFDSFAGSTGASITLTGLAVTDIEIYKDGGTTQRASDAGYTLLDTDGIDFDSITGVHGFSVDLSDNTDAGFYAVGPWYHVVVSSVTVDSQTVNFVAASFRIASATRGLAGTALPDAAADAAGGLPISDAGGLDLDTQIGTDIDAILVGTNSLNDTKIPNTLNTTALGNIGIDWANVENPTTAVDLSATDIQLSDTVTTLTGHTAQTADHTAGIADIPTVAEFNARTLVAASYFDPAADTVATVTDVTTKTGYSLSTAGILAIWHQATSAIVTAGTIGKLLVDNVNAAIGSASTHSAADVWTVATRVLTAGTNLNDISTADVNAQVLDVLNTDTFAEPASVPAATASLVDKIGWLMALGRNKLTQTATTATLRNDADGADIATSTVSDDLTTATRGEWT